MRVDATHADDDMPSGLLRRGARYVLRRRVPLDLVEVLGRTEITKALGTSDRAEAKKRHAVEWVRLDTEFEAARKATKAISLSPVAPSTPALGSGRSAKRTGFAQIIETLRDSLKDLPVAGDEGERTATSKSRSAPPKASWGMTWEALVDKWAAERTPTRKSRLAHGSVVKQFEASSGIAPAAVDRPHVIAFKDALITEGQSPANIRTKISRLKTVINYGYDNDIVVVRAADGIKLPKAKDVGRIPYDDHSLKRLFGGPVHQQGERPTRGRGEASYWLPLIGLYSGARLEEIAGLSVDDLSELDVMDGSETGKGWFIRFRPNKAENRRLKTVASERDAPVHPELIRLGLIRYLESIKASQQTQLFPLLTPHASGQRAHNWGAWFSAYRRTECSVADPRIDFHSFRHTFKDAARECGMPEGLQRQIMGHEGKDVADGYGSGFSRKLALDHLARLRFPGLPVIPPFDAET